MPINADIQMDPNQCGYSLPVDSCVGDAGPSPTEVTTISQPGGKSGSVPNELRINGGTTEGWGKSAGKAGAQGGPIRTIVSGPDLPNDYDTDDPNRA